MCLLLFAYHAVDGCAVWDVTPKRGRQARRLNENRYNRFIPHAGTREVDGIGKDLLKPRI